MNELNEIHNITKQNLNRVAYSITQAQKYAMFQFRAKNSATAIYYINDYFLYLHQFDTDSSLNMF